MPDQTFDHPAFSHLPAWTIEKLSSKAVTLIQKVYDFVETECIPAEPVFRAQLEQPGGRWKTPPLMHSLRKRAKEEGLFNLFLPKTFGEQSPGLTNLEYSCCAELMGRCYWAAQTMNCHAPDTGNMELLAKFGSEEQKRKWLLPLMRGEVLSAYSMTEPDRASSDATKIACRIERDPTDPDWLVINGRKMYGNCKYNEDVAFYILMGCSDPDNPNQWRRHSTVIVPRDTPGFRIIRNLSIMGYDHAPDGHGEYVFENARIPASNIILGEGRAFEIAQARLGPGRIHHCMRLIGQTERAYELALVRATDPQKKPRGKLIGEFDSNIERLAAMRLRLDSLRLVVLNAAHTMDIRGNKAGRYAIAQSKVLVPETAQRIIDECMQMYGGQGLTQYTPLPEMWTYARFVRLADGPDASHRHQVGRDELKTASKIKARHDAYQTRADDIRMTWGVQPENVRSVL